MMHSETKKILQLPFPFPSLEKIGRSQIITASMQRGVQDGETEGALSLRPGKARDYAIENADTADFRARLVIQIATILQSSNSGAVSVQSMMEQMQSNPTIQQLLTDPTILGPKDRKEIINQLTGEFVTAAVDIHLRAQQPELFEGEELDAVMARITKHGQLYFTVLKDLGIFKS